VNGTNHDFKMKTAEWRGYTFGKFEHITEEMNEMKVDIKDIHKKMDKNNRHICAKIDVLRKDISDRINPLQVKVAGVSAVLSLVVAIVFHLMYG
jgi:hypothetical protein